jgi:hypothetical protein
MPKMWRASRDGRGAIGHQGQLDDHRERKPRQDGGHEGDEIENLASWHKPSRSEIEAATAAEETVARKVTLVVQCQVEESLPELLWGDSFCSLVDKFGVQWMINCTVR